MSKSGWKNSADGKGPTALSRSNWSFTFFECAYRFTAENAEIAEKNNLKSDGTTTYEYDTANRVASITTTGVTTTYTYNGDGDRISQTVSDGTSPVTTTYVLDTATPLTMVLAETTGAETVYYWHALDTLAQSDGATPSYFAFDGLGSVRQLVDVSGSVALAQTFDPYGNGYASAGSAQSTLGYTGEQIDGNGFVYLRARYYNPSMGRFFQMDPSRQERNAYQYAASNPILLVDPSGLDTNWCKDAPNKQLCYSYSMVETYTGLMPIPLVYDNGVAKNPKDWYGYWNGTTEWHTPSWRRGKAAEWARQWAPLNYVAWASVNPFWTLNPLEQGKDPDCFVPLCVGSAS